MSDVAFASAKYPLSIIVCTISRFGKIEIFRDRTCGKVEVRVPVTH